MFLTVFSFGSILPLIPEYSEYFQVENKGLFFTFTLTASMLTRLVSGKASDKFGRPVVMIAGTFLLSCAMVIVAFATSSFWLFFGGVVFGISAGINSPTLFAWTADFAREGARAKAMSTMFIALESGIITGGFFGPLIYDHNIENMTPAFLLCAAIAAIALGISVWAWRQDKKKIPAS